MRRILTVLAAGLAVAAAAAPTLAQQVARAREARCGWLGISYDIDRGMVVNEVQDGSPAERAGVQAGDTIVRFNGREVRGQPFLYVPRFDIGDTIPLSIRRSGREREVSVVAAERPGGCRSFSGIYVDTDSIMRKVRIHLDSVSAILDTIRLPRIRIEHTDSGVWFFHDDGRSLMHQPFPGVYRIGPDSIWAKRFERLDDHPFMVGSFELGNRSVAGAEFSEVNPELAESLALPREGLLVLRVGSGTPAARAGLLPGDVVTAAAEAPVRTVRELRRVVSRDEPIRLDVVRKGSRRQITLPRDR